MSQQEIIIPDLVKQFCTQLRRELSAHNVSEVRTLYDAEFSRVTERYYKASKWPSHESVAPAVGNDANFLVLYKELYYRHIYSKLQVDVDDRFESFENYIELFKILNGLNAERPEIQLPESWVCDIVDEFVFQFQSFCRFRTRISSENPETIEKITNPDNQHIWAASTVMQCLHSLVKKAFHNDEKNEESQTNSFIYSLGNFALVGLLRMNCLIGDYTSALRVISPVNLKLKRNFFQRVLGCHTTLYYYMGLAYLMTRRYLDAIKTFSSFLIYVTRNKQNIPRTYQHDAIVKMIDKMHGLLAIATALCPQRLDETLHSNIREKYGDRMSRMQRGDLNAYEDMFASCCPKFIIPSMPDLNESAHQPDALKLQQQIFINEVKQRQILPEVYGYLKLCTAVNVSKIAELMESDEDTLVTNLLCLKHKMKSLRWKGGAPLSGQWVSSSDIDFFVSKDIVNASEAKPARRYGEFFIRHIIKFEETLAELNRE